MITAGQTPFLQHFLDSPLLTTRDEELAVDEEDESEDDMKNTQVLPKLKSFGEAIHCLEDVLCFLQRRGCTSEAISTGTMINNLVSRVAFATQTTLHDYYPACQ